MNASTDLKDAVDGYIDQLGLGNKQPENLYRPMAYILSLKGKRIRPVLTMLAYEAVSGQDAQQAIPMAVALELFHNFTLMHDDIMDRAPVRRGKPTVHKVWNEDIAILSGDALFAFSMSRIVEAFPEKAAVLIEEYTRVSLAVCEGQMEDMDMAAKTNVSLPEYIEMIRKKTAALLGGCLCMGALAGGATAEVVEKLREFGELLGIAFQLQDDLMDAFPPQGFGKQVGGDIIENKKTFLLLKALELADQAQHQRLRTLLTTETDPETKVGQVLELFGVLGIEGHTEGLIHQYFEKARILSRELAGVIRFEPLLDYLGEIADRKL
jgi:geranylgeranyl diphosphate synthase, type II